MIPNPHYESPQAVQVRETQVSDNIRHAREALRAGTPAHIVRGFLRAAGCFEAEIDEALA